MSLLQSLLQNKLDSTGLDWIRVETLSLSPSQKTLTADLKLAGETDLIRFTGNYSVTPGNAVRLESLTASRQWLTEVAELALAKTGREFQLPDGLKGKAIRFFL